MDTEAYLQLVMTTFIVIVLILVFILYTQGARSNIGRRIIVGPGGQQQYILGPGGQEWINTRPVIVNPVQPTQHLLGPGGIYQYQ